MNQDNIKKIDNQKFKQMLIEGKKDKALDLLKDNHGNYLKKVEMGAKRYRIFDEYDWKINYLKVFNDNENYQEGVIILCPVDADIEIRRSNFKGWYFLDEVYFTNARFLNDADFVYARFVGDVFFDRSEFKGKAYFYKNIFIGKKVSFRKTKFSNYTSFSDSIFYNDVEFRECEFVDKAKFRDAKFNGVHTDFYESRFRGYADFHGVEFAEGSCADFTHAKFYVSVTFADTRFNSKLFFRNTIFKERCEFRGAEFGDYIDLIGTDFNGSVFMDPEKLYEEKSAEPKKLIAEGGMIYKREIKEDTEEETILKDLIKNEILIEIETNKNYVRFNDYKDEKCLRFCLEEKLNKESLEHKEKIIRYWKRTKEHDEINIHAAKQLCKKMGYYDSEDYFWYWYKVYERKSRPTSKFLKTLEFIFIDFITKYFTNPWRVLLFIPATIFFFTFLYIMQGNCLISSSGICLNIPPGFWDKLYFSAITFATIGYGDLQPVGFLTKFFASVEGILGVLLISTFLARIIHKI